MCRWLAYTGSPVLLTDVLYTQGQVVMKPQTINTLS